MIRENNAIVKGMIKMKVAKAVLVLLALMFLLLGCERSSKPSIDCKRSVTYTVRAGDTLWDIAAKHADLNTYCKVYMPVFMEGIKESNYELFANNRYLQPGDKLNIYYFVKE